MTTESTKQAFNPKPKHAALKRTSVGTFGRTELAILGTPCGEIKKLAEVLIQQLSGRLAVAYVDADHKGEEGPDNPFLQAGAALHYNDKIAYQRLNYRGTFNEYQIRPFFGQQDLVLVNGNHFTAKAQIAVVDPAKPLEKKPEKLTDVRLILLQEGVSEVPAYLTAHLQGKAVPVLRLSDTEAILVWLKEHLHQQKPVLNGLVLAGGLSTRMQRDKGLLQYHGKAQREVAYNLLAEFCQEVFVSCRADQTAELEGKLNPLPDTFLGLGPKSGILSAFRHNPEAAWLVLACDLPYLNRETIAYLVENRNAAKVATSFLDSEGKFPEPLITIYEPKSYPILLQMLGMGYSCPRKTLINSDVALLQAPDAQALTNVNEPAEYEEAVRQFSVNNKQ